MNKAELTLLKRLLYIRQFINFDFLLEKCPKQRNDIKKYYKINKQLFYRPFCSWYGFMHIGLSSNGTYRRDHGYEFTQLVEIQKYIDNDQDLKIIELGCGQCANLKYLAKQRPKTFFTGIDLAPSQIGRIAPNIHVIKSDYHNLDFLDDNSVDGFFAIESLCYSTDKEMLLRLLCKKLKPDGFVAVFDGYSNKALESYSQIEALCLDVLSSSYFVPEFENIETVERAMRSAGFSIHDTLNLKDQAMPYFIEISTRVEKYCKLGTVLKIFLRLLPQDITRSMVPGYLMVELMQSDLVSYRYHILRKMETHNVLQI